ncbi:hypothetical protein, partial [Segatella paludivivens]|uniref:hypothetical protein n=1 Tax=Segatella paludivivens TaxID=185294 RepID=UPI0005C6DC6C
NAKVLQVFKACNEILVGMLAKVMLSYVLRYYLLLSSHDFRYIHCSFLTHLNGRFITSNSSNTNKVTLKYLGKDLQQ